MRAPRSRFRCGSGRSASADLCRGHPDSVGRRAVGYDCQALPATGGRCHGLWRSLVAHLTGGQGVAGSNPVSPTEVYAGQIPRGVTKPGFVQRRRGRGRDRLRVAVQPRGRATPLNWGNAKDGFVSRHRIAVRVALWSHHRRYAAAALDEFVPAGPEAVSAAAASQRLWTGADRTLAHWRIRALQGSRSCRMECGRLMTGLSTRDAGTRPSRAEARRRHLPPVPLESLG